MTEYSTQIRTMGAYVRRDGELPEGMPSQRGEIYADLIFNAVSGLLQTNLPRTYSLLGDDAWSALIAAFVKSRTATTPYFHEIANAFSAFVDEAADGCVPDLVHFETTALNVETSDETADASDGWSLTPHTRIAAYGWNVLEANPTEHPTFVAFVRDEAGTVSTLPLMPVDFAILNALVEGSTIDVAEHWRDDVLRTYSAKGVVHHSGNLVR